MLSNARRVFIVIALIVTTSAFAADPVARWEAAIGGHEKIAAVHALYREASVDIAGMKGTIKAWHSDGKYRKEEQIGPYSTIETFDGTSCMLQQGNAAPVKIEGPELSRARSAAFANANAMFFVFSTSRRGAIALDGDNTIVMKPEGGIDWRVVLDEQTSLPKSMIHDEKGHTVTVDFVSYETVDGIRMEKEIHRSMGDPRWNAVIQFTKTIVNPPIEPSLFTIAAQ